MMEEKNEDMDNEHEIMIILEDLLNDLVALKKFIEGDTCGVVVSEPDGSQYTRGFSYEEVVAFNEYIEKNLNQLERLSERSTADLGQYHKRLRAKCEQVHLAGR